MDYDYPQQQQQQQEGRFEEGNAGQFNGEEGVELEEEQRHHQYEQEGDEDYYDELQRQEDRIEPPQGGEEIERKAIPSSRDSSSSSSAGKLFVGGISWETSEDTFANYFSKFGEITDSVIMTDRNSGRPRGFGFVTFADVAVADRVIEQDHIIDGRAVEVKRTVPREDAGGRGGKRTKKIFIGGIPPSFTEEELKEQFSVYGGIVEHQIMLDHKTGRSRGFGFVTFESEESVDQIFSEGKTHELGGKRVEIKKAEPKRPVGDYGSSKAQGGYSGGSGSGSGSGSYGQGNMSGGRYGGKAGNGFGGYGNYGAYSAYNGYGGGYTGGSSGFYGTYGSGAGYGYGFGYGGPMMYGGVGGGYGGSNFNGPSGYGRAGSGYGGGRGYGRSEGGGFGTGKGYANGDALSGGYGGGKGYGGGATGSGASGRFHPYRK